MQYLAIDTTTQTIKLALFNNKTGLTFNIQEHVGRNQSENLHPILKQLLNKANISIKDIDLIVVNTGPGSYTSLRLGIATAKGLALPFNIKVIGIDSFTLLKYLYNTQEKEAIILKNSPTQLYLDNSEQQVIIEPEQISEYLKPSQKVLIDDVELYSDFLNGYELRKTTEEIKAADLINYLMNNKVEQNSLEPLYIKPLTYKKYEYKL